VETALLRRPGGQGRSRVRPHARKSFYAATP
jgi:hypothetical protein